MPPHRSNKSPPPATTDGFPWERYGPSLAFLEHLFADFAEDPQSVPDDWRRVFSQLNGSANGAAGPRATTRKSPTAPPRSAPSPMAPLRPGMREFSAARQERIDKLIRNYRVRGHIVADIDPLGRQRHTLPELDPAYYGFDEADADRVFSTQETGGPSERTLREIIDWLTNTYCRSIGVQFMHIDDLKVRQWLQDRMERSENRIQLSLEKKVRILRRLTDATVFERFLQAKFAGAKSFSLEGGESLIPLLDMAIEKAASQGAQEIVLGMAHRGRLNVLANIIGKRPREIFREFLDVDSPARIGHGDVKYHLGYSSDWITATKQKVHLSLSFNPSHLEYVNGVALGRMRAKQDRFGDVQRRRGLVILIHGDAAFAGEGVVQESLNLSELAGYSVGGAFHVIINNQLGFTTTPQEARSSGYATDVARMLQIPIFHVNGEDPEAVAQAVELALDFRAEFQRDTVIDMYCYRLRGHNEGDEPSFTQPLMYQAISRRASVRENYLDRLLSLGGIERDEAEEIAEERHEALKAEFEAAQSKDYQLTNPTPTGVWANYHGGPLSEADEATTYVNRERLTELLQRLSSVPDGFHLHPKLTRFMQRRQRMAIAKERIDWSTAEALAMASLAAEGYRIRLSGQDSARGTFSQRHAVLHDTRDGHTYVPLANVAADQAPVELVNSPLSEAGVLGFDYGYSLDWPDGLIMWEAQFGDFVNAGQVIIDQFIASAEAKWRRLSGIVLLLPHGFEGQGPEHSSARLERFLSLAAEDNMQIVNPTTPAQYFHCLRRQALRRWRKPLIVMTPKSLLRRRDCTSALSELARGRFWTVRIEARSPDAPPPERVLLCSGKVYYDLIAERGVLGLERLPIIRVEQLYPWPADELRAALAPFAPGTPAVWVQEEPANMGAWQHVRTYWDDACGCFPLTHVSRPASASPATGSKTAHDREQKELVTRALTIETPKQR